MTTPQEAARTALARAIYATNGSAAFHGPFFEQAPAKVRIDTSKWADAILAALEADPDAARAVVALLGEEGPMRNGWWTSHVCAAVRRTVTAESHVGGTIRSVRCEDCGEWFEGRADRRRPMSRPDAGDA